MQYFKPRGLSLDCQQLELLTTAAAMCPSLSLYLSFSSVHLDVLLHTVNVGKIARFDEVTRGER